MSDVPMKRIILEDGRIARISRGKSAFTTRNGLEDCTVWVSQEGWGAGYDDEPGQLFGILVWLDAATGDDVRSTDQRVLSEIGIENLKQWGFLDTIKGT